MGSTKCFFPLLAIFALIVNGLFIMKIKEDKTEFRSSFVASELLASNSTNNSSAIETSRINLTSNNKIVTINNNNNNNSNNNKTAVGFGNIHHANVVASPRLFLFKKNAENVGRIVTTAAVTTSAPPPVVINAHPYQYLLNPGKRLCFNRDSKFVKNNQNNILFIALIPIAADGFEQRMAIRVTWPNPSLFSRTRFVFLLGLSKSESVNEKVRLESEIYDDIVQENFIDTYLNLTLKTVMGLKWVGQYCPNALFTLKVDEDVVVNTYYLTKYLDNLRVVDSKISSTFMCRYYANVTVDRNPNAKFYVPTSVLAADRYEQYCDGPAYLFTTDLAEALYNQSLYTKSFHFEDVYVGMVAKNLNAKYVNITSKYVLKDMPFEWSNSSKIDNILFVLLKEPSELTTIWNYIINILTNTAKIFV